MHGRRKRPKGGGRGGRRGGELSHKPPPADGGGGAAPLALAAQATAMFVQAVTRYYDVIGRPLPDLSPSGPAR
ncbi:hypothetical protein [Nocardia abscessus]|uniref:hypothetical protein n=1 Tax=Nocardia abscessus TaxID=120957 RepID=UPI002456A07D|nr:hypothetical protein [Nocardia abscessus]